METASGSGLFGFRGVFFFFFLGGVVVFVLFCFFFGGGVVVVFFVGLFLFAFAFFGPWNRFVFWKGRSRCGFCCLVLVGFGGTSLLVCYFFCLFVLCFSGFLVLV